MEFWLFVMAQIFIPPADVVSLPLVAPEEAQGPSSKENAAKPEAIKRLLFPMIHLFVSQTIATLLPLGISRRTVSEETGVEKEKEESA
jgi:hypothetical protein